MNAIDPAERLLRSLGIRKPRDIDLELIACEAGAFIEYRNLESCEAEILGTTNEAIIAVNLSASPERKRFSVAHELGHWHHHRGRKLRCRVEKMIGEGKQKPEERAANTYAASLLMPSYLLRPVALDYKRLTFKTVVEIADLFQTSLQATAIRLVQSDIWPVILVCHGQSGRKWHARAPSVPRKWYPRETLEPDAFAFDVVFGSSPGNSCPMGLDALDWFDRGEANFFTIKEETRRIETNKSLSILTLTDADMMDSDLGIRELQAMNR